MNKAELIAAIAERTGQPKKTAATTLDATLEVIKSSLVAGDPVALVGFGSFKVQTRKGREGRNPQTGEPLTIPSRQVVRFAPGKSLSQAVK